MNGHSRGEEWEEERSGQRCRGQMWAGGAQRQVVRVRVKGGETGRE